MEKRRKKEEGRKTVERETGASLARSAERAHSINTFPHFNIRRGGDLEIEPSGGKSKHMFRT